MDPLTIDLIGYAGMAFGLGSYLARTDRTLCAVVTLAMLLLGWHYHLLGVATAAWLSAFSALRWGTVFVVSQCRPAARWAVTAAVLAAVAAIAAVTWGGWASFFTLLGNFILVPALYHLRDRSLRIALLAAELMWAATALAADSTPGLMLACSGIVLNGYVMWRSSTNRRTPGVLRVVADAPAA